MWAMKLQFFSSQLIIGEVEGTICCCFRCRLSFQCIRGGRSTQGHFVKCAPVDLIQSETQFSDYKLCIYSYPCMYDCIFVMLRKKYVSYFVTLLMNDAC